jgi:hypothetical protein
MLGTSMLEYTTQRGGGEEVAGLLLARPHGYPLKDPLFSFVL